MRGCVNGCRFCQAGMITRTQRQRSVEKVIEIAKAGFKETGYDEIGLLSLSSSDYHGITELARKLNDHFEDIGVGVSLPSLRIGTVLATLPKEMSRVRKGGLTIAPEAASERLRTWPLACASFPGSFDVSTKSARWCHVTSVGCARYQGNGASVRARRTRAARSSGGRSAEGKRRWLNGRGRRSRGGSPLGLSRQRSR